MNRHQAVIPDPYGQEAVDLVSTPAAEEALKLALGDLRGRDQRFKHLVTALEAGEIQPRAALGDLSTKDADLVRRLALGLLLQIRHHLETR